MKSIIISIIIIIIIVIVLELASNPNIHPQVLGQDGKDGTGEGTDGGA